MEVVFFLQCRVDMTEGSWPACKEVLREMAQMAKTSHWVLDRVRGLQEALTNRFPNSSGALAMLRHMAGWKLSADAVIRKPMPLRDFLALMERRMEQVRGKTYPTKMLPMCSIKTCTGQVGNKLLVCQEIFRPDQAETDVYQYQYHRQRVQGLSFTRDEWVRVRMLTALGLPSLAGHLWGQQEEAEGDTKEVFSYRRRRMVPVRFLCLACSSECYKDIVTALRMWEGPDDDHQAVVVTTSCYS